MFFATVQDALSYAMQRSTEVGDLPSAELLLLRLEGFDVEDDGSTEWQFVVDLIAMISAALDAQDISVCLRTALRSYLEGMFNVLANTYAIEDAKPISNDEVARRLANDDEWRRVIDFVKGL